MLMVILQLSKEKELCWQLAESVYNIFNYNPRTDEQHKGKVVRTYLLPTTFSTE